MAQGMKRKFARVRRRLVRRMHKLRRDRVRSAGTRVAGIDPEKIVWIFGSARTGSTWLAAMMADLKGHTGRPEPMVGHLFGHLYYERAANRHDNDLFILGGDEELWLKPLRAFVLDSAKARFPQVAEKGGYLVIKEPHGSQGAPLLMRALPESRMILLVRDPRDVVASQMDLSREGGRVRQAAKARGVEKKNTSADERPDAFVKSHAKRYLQNLSLAKQAYDVHGGRKVPRVTTTATPTVFHCTRPRGRQRGCCSKLMGSPPFLQRMPKLRTSQDTVKICFFLFCLALPLSRLVLGSWPNLRTRQ